MTSPLDLLHFSDSEEDDELDFLIDKESPFSETPAPKQYKDVPIFGQDVDEVMKKGQYKFITRASMFHQLFPDQIKDFPATEEERMRMPNLLFWRQYGTYKPESVCGAEITASEEWALMKNRIEKKEQRKHLAQTRKDIKEGKQPKLTAFFQRGGAQKKPKNAKGPKANTRKHKGKPTKRSITCIVL